MQGSNTIKTTLLLGALTGLFVVIGGALAGHGGMVFAFGLAVVMNLGAWWFSDKIALRISGAHELSETDAPDLHRMVAVLAVNAGLPKPRVYVMDTPMPNAFATGRDPQHSAVAVTTGITQLLSREELAGVIAHELAHIKHRDTLISSIAATFAGAISMLADIAMWSMIFGGSSDDDSPNPFGGILTLIFAPIAALLIQMAISRSREFSADAGGAQILGNPLPLASALEKLEQAAHTRIPTHISPATSHMYIVNPLSGGMGGLTGLFRTHPHTAERVARLRAMTVRRSETVFA